MKKNPQHRDMQFRVEYDKRPPPLGLALRHLPSLAIAMIGTLCELPLERAESINEDIDKARQH